MFAFFVLIWFFIQSLFKIRSILSDFFVKSVAFDVIYVYNTYIKSSTAEDNSFKHSIKKETLMENTNTTNPFSQKQFKEIFAKEDVDGGLIGGAALKADDFVSIIKSI